jgi:hypothetical protein
MSNNSKPYKQFSYGSYKFMNRYLSAFILILLWSSTVIADDNATGRISGAWIPSKLGPISGGLIYAFNTKSGPPPLREQARRVPDAMVMTNNEGGFSLELEEGTYYLSTLKKIGGNTPGPPQDGDLHGLSRDEKDNPIIYRVKRGMTTDIGILRKATAYQTPTVKETKGMTAIAGVLKASDGSPLANAVVQVYTNQETKGKPTYVSNKTGKNGKYIVQVDHEGTYFVTVRTANSGGRPINGDLYGIYGGESAQPVLVTEQNVTPGIDIQVGQFVDNRPE